MQASTFRKNNLPFMNAGITIFLWLAVLSIVCFIWLERKKRKLEQNHRKRASFIQRNIYLNINQIELRKSGLDKYDFLSYNLNEALIVQNEICVLL